MCTNNADLVLSNNNTYLWLGNFSSALNFNFLKNNNISVIVNCTYEIPFIYDINLKFNSYLHVESIRIPIGDTNEPYDNLTLSLALPKVINFIKTKFFKEHKNILIHCAAGKSRSASVLAAFLFDSIKEKNNKQEQNISDNELMINIIHYIIDKRSCTFYYGTKFNFLSALNSQFNLTLEEKDFKNDIT